MANSAACDRCGRILPTTATACFYCGHSLRPPEPTTVRYTPTLDTKSFVLPARRKIMWVWILISVGLPLLMSITYFILHLLWG